MNHMNEHAFPGDTQAETRDPQRYQGTGQIVTAAGPGCGTRAQADLEDAGRPVPYTLTAKAEALLAHEASTAAGYDAEAGSSPSSPAFGQTSPPSLAELLGTSTTRSHNAEPDLEAEP